VSSDLESNCAIPQQEFDNVTMLRIDYESSLTVSLSSGINSACLALLCQDGAGRGGL